MPKRLQSLLNEQKYDAAIAAFASLHDYADSAERIPATRYENTQSSFLKSISDMISPLFYIMKQQKREDLSTLSCFAKIMLLRL